MEYTRTKTRSYSITSEDDSIHTFNGRCPSYALNWDQNNNEKHWPKGHDYYLGNGTNINDGTADLREILSQKLANGTLTKHIIFCDLDGVLADFEEGVRQRFKKNVDEIKPGLLWGVINKSKTFFETLPWMPRGRELWDRIKQYHPIILTGVPSGNLTAIEQKIKWCQRELGPDVKVITCLTKDKAKYCFGRSILIDDRLTVLESWKDKGGKCVLYDEDNFYTNLERIDRHMEFDSYSP